MDKIGGSLAQSFQTVTALTAAILATVGKPIAEADIENVSVRHVVCTSDEITGLPPGGSIRTVGTLWALGGGVAAGAVTLQGPGVDSSNDGALLGIAPGGSPNLLLREGQSIGGGTLIFFNDIVVSANGTIAARIGISGAPDGGSAIVVGGPGGLSIVSASGDDVSADFNPENDPLHPDSRIGTKAWARLSSSGSVGFQSDIRVGQVGTRYRALYTASAGAKTLQVRSDENYPGLPGGDDTYFDFQEFGSDPLMNSAGDLLFLSLIDDDDNDISPIGARGVWRASSGTISEIIHSG